MQIIGTILCIFINSPLLLRIPQKSALLFDNTLCPIPYGAAEYKLSNTVNSDIFDVECAFAAEFRTFFLFLSLKSCLFTHCCGTIQSSLYLPWRFGSYAISLIGVCFAQSRAILFIERKNHHEKKMRQTHC